MKREKIEKGLKHATPMSLSLEKKKKGSGVVLCGKTYIGKIWNMSLKEHEKLLSESKFPHLVDRCWERQNCRPLYEQVEILATSNKNTTDFFNCKRTDVPWLHVESVSFQFTLGDSGGFQIWYHTPCYSVHFPTWIHVLQFSRCHFGFFYRRQFILCAFPLKFKLQNSARVASSFSLSFLSFALLSAWILRQFPPKK